MARILIILLFPTLCFAGGDYSEVNIKEFKGGESSADFTIEFLNDRKFDESCDVIKVQLKYMRVPWYSWLPFVHSSHPTSTDTQKSVAYLKSAFENNETVNFGYIGYGLKASDKSCEFISKGLRLDGIDDFHYIMSFHDPV
ncbi:MAG: hypothetical protein KKE30_05350 [Gammaproteobacteria bacterium]|nr:hypothetical protein [Gammaproteobacteria bacterium]MBU1556453.1 hypothetical protein [Gammaproteobacteria bacterium]MBU2070149.1 hypothetical protein [Gammaproteobacteria bacterium]MBU2181900.1 hypothetical protein [Gammaproteobacteria bacterium]MBU2205502.1 hypothetical protein [Gammaproteobacteria bacterium]